MLKAAFRWTEFPLGPLSTCGWGAFTERIAGQRAWYVTRCSSPATTPNTSALLYSERPISDPGTYPPLARCLFTFSFKTQQTSLFHRQSGIDSNGFIVLYDDQPVFLRFPEQDIYIDFSPVGNPFPFCFVRASCRWSNGRSRTGVLGTRGSETSSPEARAEWLLSSR